METPPNIVKSVCFTATVVTSGDGRHKWRRSTETAVPCRDGTARNILRQVASPLDATPFRIRRFDVALLDDWTRSLPVAHKAHSWQELQQNSEQLTTAAWQSSKCAGGSAKSECTPAAIFKQFRSRTPTYIFSSALYPQSCWCLIQVTHCL